VKLGRIFIGKHTEPVRPINVVDEDLMRRIAEAKERLRERNIEPVAILRLRQTQHASHVR
jgi:hypothetical protein